MESFAERNEVSYSNYNEVPKLRRQLAFWILMICLPIVNLALLVSGGVHYKSGGNVNSFNPVIKTILAFIASLLIINQVLILRTIFLIATGKI